MRHRFTIFGFLMLAFCLCGAAYYAIAADLKPARDIFIGAAIPAELIRVIDGDTVEVRAHIWLGQSVVTRVRLQGVDAPELKARCDDELHKAEAARDVLRQFIIKNKFYLTGIKQDKYGGRVVANIVNEKGEDAGQYLLEKNLVRSYDGGRRQGWC